MVQDCGHVDVTDLMREWVELGDREKNPYMRFVAYWVAFNMLYEGYKTNGRREYAAIWECYKAHKYSFDQYVPFNNNEVEIFMSDVATGLYKRDEDDPEEECLKIKRNNRRALLYAVYRVRCNFFHGNKRLGDETDRAFVASGATIIRNYLGTLDFIPEASNECLLPDSVLGC